MESPLHIPEYPNYQLPDDEQRILAPTEVRGWLRDRIEGVLSQYPQAVLSFDGPSGSGKTTHCKSVEREYGGEDEPHVVHLEADRFLGTLVGSKERAQMLESPENFWSMVNDWDTFQGTLEQIHDLGEDGGVVNLRRTYHRDHFRNDEKIIIPEGKKVLVVSGLKITDTIGHIYGEDQRVKGLVYAPGKTSLVSALLRDMKRGKMSDIPKLFQRTNQRKKECEYQLPVFNKMMRRPDVTVIDNTSVHPDFDEMYNEYYAKVMDMLTRERERIAAVGAA